jgi:peptidoglycan/xylan/chitin deacetylase (PgdA/CDA1 family)
MSTRAKDTKYLLRFDDICPTMNWDLWSEIEAELVERKLKPILAVVPDNQDPELQIQPAVQDFWARVREWQARGWTIALHGYQHRYVTRHAGIVTIKKNSEFAGVLPREQEHKLRQGVRIFEEQGIHSDVWIAPSNSFDAVTVSLLPKFGLTTICDGYFRFPFVCRRDLFWIPHQIFSFRPAPPGVWTVCYHHNKWSVDALAHFRRDLDEYGPAISNVDEVRREWDGRRSWWTGFLCDSPYLAPALVRWQLKLWGWWKSRKAKAQSMANHVSVVGKARQRMGLQPAASAVPLTPNVAGTAGDLPAKSGDSACVG